MSDPDWSRWNVKDPVAFLLDDIQDAEKVEVGKDDDWSFLFIVTFKDGLHNVASATSRLMMSCQLRDWRTNEL